MRPRRSPRVAHALNELASHDLLSIGLAVALHATIDDWSFHNKRTDAFIEAMTRCWIIRFGRPPVEFHPVICR